MEQKLIDIEVYPNFFFLGIMDLKTQNITSFEISPFRDERKGLYDFLNNYKGFWISFNGNHYDNLVLAYGQDNKWFINDPTELCNSYLKEFSDKIINSDDYSEIKRWKYWKWKFTSIDLFLYWSKMLRLSKNLSLKSLGIQLGFDEVQELPYEPSRMLTESEMEEIKRYNLRNDLGILYLLCKDKNADIQQRSDAVVKYGLNCWSWDPVKLGLRILLQEYTNKQKLSLEKIKDLRTPLRSLPVKDIILPIIKFSAKKDEYCQNTKDGIFCSSFSALLENLRNRVVTSTTELNYSVIFDGVQYDVKSGGLHSYHSTPEIVEPDPKIYSYRDVDVSSYYPTSGVVFNFTPSHLPGMSSVLDDLRRKRLEFKKMGVKKEAELLKLALNGGFYGNLNQEHTPLYDPEKMLSITINGQLLLLMLCEKFVEAGIKIDMCNTDGVTVIFEHHLESKYKEICKWWEDLTSMELEEVIYKKVVRMNINNYLAIYEDGKVKRKGIFRLPFNEYGGREIPLGDSCDFLVIPKLLNEYFVNGHKPEEVLSQPEKFNLSILDFCASKKVDRSYTVEWNRQKKQRLNRYYVSRNGAYMYKCRNGTKSHMLKGWGVQIYNKIQHKSIKEHNVDNRYYLSEANKIINLLQISKNQLKLL